MTASWPSLDGTLMRTRPCKMAILLWPGAPFGEDSGSGRVSSSMRRCEDGVGILVAESGEQEGASEEIAPLANADPIKFAPNQPKIGPPGSSAMVELLRT